nr:unnamed protein product [Callosobruchus analis]
MTNPANLRSMLEW